MWLPTLRDFVPDLSCALEMLMYDGQYLHRPHFTLSVDPEPLAPAAEEFDTVPVVAVAPDTPAVPLVPVAACAATPGPRC